MKVRPYIDFETTANTPGTRLYDSIVRQNGISITFAAARLRVSQPHLSLLIKNERGITEEMSNRIAEVFGGDPNEWHIIQLEYNIEMARRGETKKRRPRLKAFPASHKRKGLGFQ